VGCCALLSLARHEQVTGHPVRPPGRSAPSFSDTTADSIAVRHAAIDAFTAAFGEFVWDGGLLTDELKSPINGKAGALKGSGHRACPSCLAVFGAGILAVRDRAPAGRSAAAGAELPLAPGPGISHRSMHRAARRCWPCGEVWDGRESTHSPQRASEPALSWVLGS
jgi:hypothetical protein